MTLAYKQNVWIGFERRERNAQKKVNAQDWKWKSGEECMYTHWTSYENNPDNKFGNEFCVHVSVTHTADLFQSCYMRHTFYLCGINLNEYLGCVFLQVVLTGF